MMDSIFPDEDESYEDVVDSSTDQEEELSLLKEYAWDFEKNDFAYENGRFKIVEGLEAIKVWIYKALLTERYRYPAYSWDYGQEFEELIGNTMSDEELQGEAERLIDECLSVNPYIKGIGEVAVVRDGDLVSLSVTVDTEYGEVKVDV